MADYLNDIFSANGIFAQKLSGYELRQGQLDMATAVDEAISEGNHLLVEAACGIGKSIAYSTPAIAHAVCNGQRIVICTANIALQEQLHFKDLPALQKHLPWSFTHSLLKGRNNFFCHEANILLQVEDLDGSTIQEANDQIKSIRFWAKTSSTGDKSDLGFEPDPIAWSKLSCTSDDCKGENCSFREICFFEKAKAEAHESQIIVTNYHMLFGHIAVRRSLGINAVLPAFDVLILDEGHECAEIARNFMGYSLSKAGLKPIIKWSAKFYPELSTKIDKESTAFFRKAKQVFKSKDYKIRLRDKQWTAGKEQNLYKSLIAVSAKAFIHAKSKDAAKEDKKYATEAYNACLTYAKRLEGAAHLNDDNAAYWLETGKRDQIFIKSRPIFVDKYIKRELFDSTRSVIMTSATLSTGKTFGYIKKELGAPEDIKTLQIDSPFDFNNRTLLVVPKELPSVKEAAYPNALSSKMKELLCATDGRTLSLFTSIKTMKMVHESLTRKNLPYKLLLQGGNFSRKELCEQFKKDTSSCLFGVASFWTGIDVPGNALISVIIDKLPFPNVSDPIVDAINEKDKDSFWNYMVPRAIIILKQGIGRLLRRATDYGVVAIMDNRLLTGSRWSKAFLLSMPPMRSTTDISDIKPFLHYLDE